MVVFNDQFIVGMLKIEKFDRELRKGFLRILMSNFSNGHLIEFQFFDVSGINNEEKRIVQILVMSTM